MEPRSVSNYTSKSKLRLFPSASPTVDDPNTMDFGPSSSSSSASTSSSQERKRYEVVSQFAYKDLAGAVEDGETSADYKNKQQVQYNKDLEEQIKQASPDDSISSSLISQDGGKTNELNSLEADAINYSYSDSDGYNFDEDDNEEYDYYEDLFDADPDYNLAAKFDDMDLPPGVEATVPWLQEPAPDDTFQIKPVAVIEDEIDMKYKEFEQFDTVVDCADHRYGNPTNLKEPPLRKAISNKKLTRKDWIKRIQHEWKLLKKDLPESIYVRVYEDRMDILRAAIVGPPGTPYHDGLFFFDVFFPDNYPYAPPLVHYHSGGLAINPNLYACGKVCLSLLGTWLGSGCEKWNPLQSTMLQVLVSIQALILNEKPYFNEPIFSNLANTTDGQKSAYEYNKDTFLLSCKTMLYSLRRPPKHFEDFVAGHFRKYGRIILKACLAYLSGFEIGSDIEAFDISEEAESSSRPKPFQTGLKKLYEDLLMEFTVKGADCKIFLANKIKRGKAASKAEVEQKQVLVLANEKASASS